MFAYYPSLFWIINEYSKQTVYFSIVIHSRVTQDSLFFARAKINFRLLFFSLSRQYGPVMFWTELLSMVSICTGFGRNAGTFLSLFDGFSGIFRRHNFFSFFQFFFSIFFQGRQDGQNPGIPENPGELDRLCYFKYK